MRQILRFVPAAAIIATSCYLSSLSRIEEMPSFWNADKLVHVICFAGLAFWMAFGCSRPAWRVSRGSRIWLWVTPVILVALYGCIDEIHQSFTPGRSCTFDDWCADVIGAMIGSYVHFLLVSSECALSAWWRKFAGLTD